MIVIRLGFALVFLNQTEYGKCKQDCDGTIPVCVNLQTVETNNVVDMRFLNIFLQIVQGSEIIISTTKSSLKWIEYKKKLPLKSDVKVLQMNRGGSKDIVE